MFLQKIRHIGQSWVKAVYDYMLRLAADKHAMFFFFVVDNYPYIRRKNELLFGIISELTDNIEFQTYFNKPAQEL